MNIRKIIVGLALGVLGWATAQGAGKDGFVSIFDGKTLKGWEAMPARDRAGVDGAGWHHRR